VGGQAEVYPGGTGALGTGTRVRSLHLSLVLALEQLTSHSRTAEVLAGLSQRDRSEFRFALRAGAALRDVLTDASPRCAMAEGGCALNGRSRFGAVECGYSAIFRRRDEVVD
jgi:hypothetical protein